MDYTTFVEDQDRKPSNLEKLDWLLQSADSAKQEVYILTMANGNFRNPDNSVRQFAKLKGVHSAICVNGTINVIIRGNQSAARELARELHERTGEKISIIKYDPAAHTYLDIREAMDVTRRKGDAWHVYDPCTESIDALLRA